MTDDHRLQLAARWRDARIAGGDAGRRQLLALLHPKVAYRLLGRQSDGAEAVTEELVSGPCADLARRLDWEPPRLHEGRVQLRGRRRGDARDRDLVATLTIEGDAIVRVEEQRLPAPPISASALVLPAALRQRIDRALAERHPMLLAHVDEQGQPVLSFRGSVQAHSDDQLALWVRNPEGGFIRAIRANPRVALMYRDEDAKATYQFQGRARVTDDPAERQRIFERSPEVERAHDFARLGAAVVVHLDRVEGYAGLGPQGQVDPLRLQRQPARP